MDLTQSSKALSVPELLHEIFWHMDKASNASNARVCRQWMNVALDILWCRVENIQTLFNVLAPLELMADRSYSFTRALEPNDWRNFNRYRSRVKTLSYPGASRLLHHSAFAQVAITRPTLTILPQLRNLNWRASELMPCYIFMHDRLQSFSINLSSESRDMGAFFRQSTVIITGITTLDLCLDFEFNVIEQDIAQLLPQLKNLRTLVLLPFCFTTKIAEVAATLPRLESIQFGSLSLPSKSHLHAKNFAPLLRHDAYPSLATLSIGVSLRDAVTFMSRLTSPEHLTKLYLDSPVLESPLDFHYLSVVIANMCPRLKTLVLLSSYKEHQSWAETNIEHQFITIDTLRPLYRFTDLTMLEIAHPYALRLQLADIDNIAKTMPNIEHLDLNNQPVDFHQSSLTLDALLPFAQHCLQLHTLGIFIDATVDKDRHKSKPGIIYPVFRKLRCLMVGLSIIEDEEEVACFLSRICPIECDLIYDATRDFSENYEDAAFDRSGKWHNVMGLLPLLTRVRIEEREQRIIS